MDNKWYKIKTDFFWMQYLRNRTFKESKSNFNNKKCNKMTKQERKDALKTGMKIMNSSKKKIRYCYLVYCNKEPIVYSVYSSAKEALYYAEYLINLN